MGGCDAAIFRREGNREVGGGREKENGGGGVGKWEGGKWVIGMKKGWQGKREVWKGMWNIIINKVVKYVFK